MTFSNRIKVINPSSTMALTAKANEMRNNGEDIIVLTVGEPDFDTPSYIKDAALSALKSGQTKYTSVDGTSEIKSAIQQKFSNDNNLSYEIDEIIVSNGCKQSIFNFLQVLIDDGDEVILPTPFWVSYIDMIKYAGGKPVFLDTSYDNNLNIVSEDLDKIITSKTKLLLINSPNNPSGKCYSPESLKSICDVIENKKNIFFASDDIYEHIRWSEDPFQNILNVCPTLQDRTVIFNGVSKAFSMTGWRIGYAAGPNKIINQMKKLQSQSTSCPSAISQAAATVALNNKSNDIQLMTKEYKKRHDYVVSELNNIEGVECKDTDGTFYIFPSFKELVKNNSKFNNDKDLALFLLETAKVAVVPGSAFGFEGHLRISIAVDMQSLKEAMIRIKKSLQD